jgi:hypothetical protein
VSRRNAIAASAPSTTDTNRPTLRSSCISFVGRITKRAAAGAHPTWSVWMAIPTAVATPAANPSRSRYGAAIAEGKSRGPGAAASGIHVA